MIRIISYIICVACAGWLLWESIVFRQSLRANKDTALGYLVEYEADAFDPDGKILNGFYEDVYHDIPNMILPGIIMLSGATILLLKKQK
jgi:hypothetical protein